MFLWIVFSTGLALAYAAIMYYYVAGWRALPDWEVPVAWSPKTRLSILIPARNEAARIGPCIASICAGSYPLDLLEILVIDDFSDDATAAEVHAFKARALPVRLLQLSNLLPPKMAGQANKKRGIELAIAVAKGDIIVTTDADCLAGKDWLRLLISRLESSSESLPHPVLVTGPVLFHREKNLLQYFQSLDFAGLMGITGAGIHRNFQRMGNGAHLAYFRSAFLALGGYEGNRQTASGDDMFLIQKMAAAYPGRVAFLKNVRAVVLTEAKSTWRGFVQQRLRWGSKNAGLPEWPVRLVLLAVFLFCWSIWLHLFTLCLFPKHHILLQTLVFQVIIKIIFDWLLLREMCCYFQRKDLLRWFLPSFVLHTLYIPLIGTAGLFFKKYSWKGREVSGLARES